MEIFEWLAPFRLTLFHENMKHGLNCVRFFFSKTLSNVFELLSSGESHIFNIA